MAWVKLDDAMPTHPKLMAAGPVAFALDVAGICYSNKHSTDGFIADYALAALFPGMPNPRKVAGKLVEVGRWVEVEGGWLIHDVHDYQPTAEQQKEISKKRAEAGRKGGSKSKRSTEADANQSAKQVASGPDNPVPSRPDPTRTRKSNPPSTGVDPEVSQEARDLTRQFAIAVKANGFKVPKAGQRNHGEWLKAMDQLLRLGEPGGEPDPQDPGEVAKVITFATSDDFWKANIRSPGKFREQYPALRLRMSNAEQEQAPRPVRQDPVAARYGANAR